MQSSISRPNPMSSLALRFRSIAYIVALVAYVEVASAGCKTRTTRNSDACAKSLGPADAHNGDLPTTNSATLTTKQLLDRYFDTIRSGQNCQGDRDCTLYSKTNYLPEPCPVYLNKAATTTELDKMRSILASKDVVH